MNKKILTKPNNELPSQNAFPQEIERIYDTLKENLTAVQIESLDDLIMNVYKIAYMDAVKDMLYFHDL